MPQIFAIGGGGFDSDSVHGNSLDKYFLELTGETKPTVCLIPTASGDSQIRQYRFLRACAELGIQGKTLELFRLQRGDFYEFLSEFSAIFVSGGNTRNMLVLWKEWGLEKALHKHWQEGKLIGGVSAGANCWFEKCSTDSNPGELSIMDCLGWIPDNCCPHYDEEINRKPSLEALMRKGEIGSTLAIDGGAGVLYDGTGIKSVFASKDGKGAYKVELIDGVFTENKL